jgi:16S rRNA (adenine1518-N6/adenine1519-N6)-dimethyltransferase
MRSPVGYSLAKEEFPWSACEMNLSEIKATLSAAHIQLTKSLGQNFLHDSNQLRKIVEIAELVATDEILEIGPGLGALTQPLLERGPRVLAIEKDRRLSELLRQRLAGLPQLTLLQADALDYLQEHKVDWSAWKLVSNLPYSVASPILVELAKSAGPPARMVVTVQLEVAQRLAAAPNTKAYGILSLLIQAHFEPKGLFRIPATCFFPVPDIDSACLLLQRRNQPLLGPGEYPVFEKVVKRSFSQRRKMMLKLLKADWPAPRLELAFAALGLASQARAETVALEQFVELTKLLSAFESK